MCAFKNVAECINILFVYIKKKACVHAQGLKVNFFASAQCLGYRNEFGTITDDICFPTEKNIIKQVFF